MCRALKDVLTDWNFIGPFYLLSVYYDNMNVSLLADTFTAKCLCTCRHVFTRHYAIDYLPLTTEAQVSVALLSPGACLSLFNIVMGSYLGRKTQEICAE